jgi:hypothetical protein
VTGTGDSRLATRAQPKLADSLWGFRFGTLRRANLVPTDSVIAVVAQYGCLGLARIGKITDETVCRAHP